MLVFKELLLGFGCEFYQGIVKAAVAFAAEGVADEVLVAFLVILLVFFLLLCKSLVAITRIMVQLSTSTVPVPLVLFDIGIEEAVLLVVVLATAD